ncbi:MAG: ABC transporter substrate-binding protein [Gammaproteobacteria bacterium]|nr:ABC transporter substrate-binding protein [Gammaproteobacteria bacterium]
MLRRISTILVTVVALAALALPTAAQQRGGVLKFAVPNFKPGLDPAKTSTGDGYMLTAMIFSNLTRVDENLEPQPQLAERWEPNADSSEWTFYLRKDAKFSNGRPVIADDVVFSIKRILDPETASKGAKALGPIGDVVAMDTHTVVFKLTGPYADLPLQMGNTFSRIIAKENVDEVASKPIGSGPFILKEYTPGSRAILVRNPDYFEQGVPYLDEVHQVYIKEYAAQMSALKTGEVHIMYLAPVEIMPQLKEDPNIEVRQTSAPSFQPLVMNVEKKPFSDVRVRQALRYALDRQAMLDAATGGFGSLGNDHPVPPGSPFYDKAQPQRVRDVGKAKALLAEAGYPDGIDITLYTSTARPGLEEAAVVAQQTLRDAGFRIKIESVEIGRLYDQILPNLPEFAISHNNWFGRPTIDETLTPYYYTKSNWNYSNFSDPEVDKLLDQGKSSTDPAERKKIYAKVQEILLERGSEAVPYFRNYVSAVRKEVQNYRLIPVQYVDLREVWLKK